MDEIERDAADPYDLTSSASSTSPNIDGPFLEYAWRQLICNPEVLVGEHGQNGNLTLAEAEASHEIRQESCHATGDAQTFRQVTSAGAQESVAAPNSQPDISAPCKDGVHTVPIPGDAVNTSEKANVPVAIRLYATENRMWYALTGHGPDPSRVRSFDFEILSIIAAWGAKGILQHDLVRISGQDKRSLPHRTDRLCEDGYIEKTRVTALTKEAGGTRKLPTSLCTLKRFAKDADHRGEVSRLTKEANAKTTRRMGTNSLGGKHSDSRLSSDTVAQEPLHEIEGSLTKKVPQWTADRSLSNQIFDVVDRGGTEGVTLPELRDELFGAQYKKPMENFIGRLVDAWQISQPLHLRHLALVRDTVLKGKSPVYIHYTYENFKKLVDTGKASWEAVVTVSSSVKNGKDVAASLDAQPELEEYGFPQLDASDFLGHQNDATLVECVSKFKADPAVHDADGPFPPNVPDNDFSVKSTGDEHALRSTLRHRPTLVAQPEAMPDTLGDWADPGVNSSKKVRCIERTTVVKRGRGRPRKSLKNEIPSDLDSMSLDEVKHLHHSQQTAGKYQKRKIEAEINRRIDLGAHTVGATHEVLQETDDLIVKENQDPIFPHVRAQILHEYAGGLVPEPSELETALARFTGNGSYKPRKRRQQTKKGSQTFYWPSVAAHTLRVLYDPAADFLARKHRDSHAKSERRKQPEPTLFRYLPSICAHSGSFLPSVIQIPENRDAMPRGAKRTSTKSRRTSGYVGNSPIAGDYAMSDAASSGAVPYNRPESTTVAQEEYSVADAMVKRYSEQIGTIKRPRNGVFAGKSLVLRRRLGEPKTLPKLNYKILIIKLDQLRILDWITANRKGVGQELLTQGEDEGSGPKEISHQIRSATEPGAEPEAEAEIQPSQPFSELNPCRDVIYPQMEEKAPEVAHEEAPPILLSELDLGNTAEVFRNSFQSSPAPSEGNRFAGLVQASGEEISSKKRKRVSNPLSTANGILPGDDSPSKPRRRRQKGPIIGLFATTRKMPQSLQVQAVVKTFPFPSSQLSYTSPYAAETELTPDRALPAVDRDEAGKKGVSATTQSEQRSVEHTKAVDERVVEAAGDRESNDREACELRDQTPSASGTTLQSQARVHASVVNQTLGEDLGVIVEDSISEQAQPTDVTPEAENAVLLRPSQPSITEKATPNGPPLKTTGAQPDISENAVQNELPSIEADEQANGQEERAPKERDILLSGPREQKDHYHDKIAVDKMTRTGGSTAMLRKDIIMDLVTKSGGASPGFRELSIPFAVEWSKRGQVGLPETNTVRKTVNALCAAGKLRQITFAYQTKQGLARTNSMLTLPEISTSDPKVKEVQDEMAKLGHTRMYLPKAWLMEDVAQRAESISAVNSHKNPQSYKRPDALQRLLNHKSFLQKVAKSEEDRLAALEVVKERNQQRAQRASTQNDASGEPSVTQQKRPVQRLASLRRSINRLPTRLIKPSSRGTPRNPLDEPRRAYSKRIPSSLPLGPTSEVQRTFDEENRLYAGDIHQRPQAQGIVREDMQRSTWQMKPLTLSYDLDHDSHSLPSEDLLPPRYEWDPYGGYPMSLSNAPTHVLPNPSPEMPSTPIYSAISRSDSSDTESMMSSAPQIPIPLIPPRMTRTYNRKGEYTLPVIPGFMAPQQSFHEPTGTFGTSFSAWLRTFRSVSSIREKMPAAQTTSVSKMQPPFLKSWAAKQDFSGKTSPQNHQKRFELAVEKSEVWELSAAGLEDIVFPDWTFINYTLQHPHKRVESGIASVHEGRLCSFTGRNGRLRSKPIGPLLKSRLPVVADLYDSRARMTPKNRAENQPSEVTPVRMALKRRRVQSISQSESDSGYEDGLQPLTPVRSVKRHRVRGPRELRRFGEEDEKRLVMAVMVVRCLTGGIDKRIDWDLVARAFEPRLDANLIHPKWNHVRQKHKYAFGKLEAGFQELFTKAYEEGTVPAIDYENLAAYPWNWLVQWVMENIDKPTHVVPNLPLDRSYLLNKYSLNGVIEDDLSRYYELDQALATHAREAIINRHAWTYPVHWSGLNIRDEDNPALSIARTWIRANIVTPDATYDPDLARATLGTFPDDTINAALQSLLADKVLSQEKKPRPAPGRNYSLHDHMLARLQKNIVPTDFHRAVTFKYALDSEFASHGKSEYSPHAENGDVMAILNLVAARRVTLVTKNVPMNKFGHTDGDYQTRQMDKRRLFCSVEIHPLPSYVPGNPLLPLPQPPAHHLLRPPQPSIKSKIPLWYDIHGSFVSSMWELVLSAIMAVLVTRPGIDKEEIEKALRPALESWECEWVLEWIVAAGAGKVVGRVGKSLKYATDEWWYLVLGS